MLGEDVDHYSIGVLKVSRSVVESVSGPTFQYRYPRVVDCVRQLWGA